MYWTGCAGEASNYNCNRQLTKWFWSFEKDLSQSVNIATISFHKHNCSISLELRRMFQDSGVERRNHWLWGHNSGKPLYKWGCWKHKYPQRWLRSDGLSKKEQKKCHDREGLEVFHAAKSISKSQDLKIFCVFKILMDLNISEAFCDMYNYKMTEWGSDKFTIIQYFLKSQRWLYKSWGMN